MFGAFFDLGARCAFHKADEDNDMGVNPITDGTQINKITNLYAAAQYGDAMSSFNKVGVDRLVILYNRHLKQLHLKELIVKVICDSPVVEDASTNNFIPETNISNLPIRFMGHQFVVDGVPRGVIHYDRGVNVVRIINGDTTNKKEV
jgi:hypothetical protein